MSRNFREILNPQWDAKKFVCVGLDSDAKKLPKSVEDQYHFNLHIIDATRDVACAYKLNLAFYRGSDGKMMLRRTIRDGMRLAPRALWILDAKYLDIGNTNDGYVAEAFEYFGVDAVTIHNYLGREATMPFLARKDKLIIVLCRTSNPGAGEFQDLTIDRTGFRKLYEVVAHNVAASWNTNSNCGLVVGATAPEELQRVRTHAPDLPLLIPGIGAQGGDLEATAQAAGGKMLINSSRGIIFASSGDDYFDAARREALKLDAAIRAALP